MVASPTLERSSGRHDSWLPAVRARSHATERSDRAGALHWRSPRSSRVADPWVRTHDSSRQPTLDTRVPGRSGVCAISGDIHPARHSANCCHEFQQWITPNRTSHGPPGPIPTSPADPPTGATDVGGRYSGGKQVPGDLEPFRRFSKQLVDGVVGFDYPRRMTAEDRSDVRLRVSVQKALQELRDSLTRDGRQPIVEATKLSPRMKADLQGFGFDIKSLSSSEQALDADEDTTWIWDVRAKEAGTQKLTVTLTALIDVGDSEGARDVSTFYREVEVEALPQSWSQRVLGIAMEYGPSRDVVWPAIPTVAAAIWAFMFAQRRGRRKRARRA